VNGEPVATQSILRDVTEQRLAERRLEESERNLEALVENTGDSIWSVDREHRLITLNSAFSLAIEARTGREPKAGMLPSQLLPSEDDAQWYRELYARTLAGERHVAVRTDHVDGQLRYFELYANPIQSLEGVIGAVFFGKDVTQRVRAEEALQMAKDEAEAANKAKSDFLANMSHELRTPLNSVIGFTNVLLKNKDGRLNEKDVGFLNRVLANGKHLLALINEVLDLAKVEAGRMELIIEEVDLAELCVETVQQLEGQAKAKDGNVTLVADVPEAVARVETDSAKLKQVIINLVGNALKFTHGGSVTVRLELAPDGHTPTAIAVQDTGIGIPEDRLEAIFEAFQQAEAGTSRKYGGTGLGLALSRSICLLMGYDLMVESELGQGSTFKIVMGERAGRPVKPDEEEGDAEAEVTAERPGVAGEPAPREKDAMSLAGVTLVGADGNRHGAAAEPDAPHGGEKARHVAVGGPTAAARGGADGDGKGPGAGAGEHHGPGFAQTAKGNFKVLVVDDETDSRVLIQHILEEFGCQVFTAKNGDEGLRLAHEHQPDLMTVDLIMPGMTGWEVLRRLKSHPKLRSIPVVVVSVVANEGRGKLLGAVDLIMKPFEREDLLRVIWRNLGRRLGGRVLLMVDDPDRRGQLADVVHTRGLEVADPAGSEFMVALAREAPDAVVMDLSMPGLHGVAELLQLRDDRALTGLPVLALTHPGLNAKERELVGELATIHADPSAGPAQLEKLLDVSFAAAEAEA
jgi:PAS domain S-box-containing protein